MDIIHETEVRWIHQSVYAITDAFFLLFSFTVAQEKSFNILEEVPTLLDPQICK